jgi:DNA ligase-1
MRSNEIHAIITNVAAVSGKKDKEVLLKQYIDDLDFRNVLQAALDPRVSYYIEAVPEPVGVGDKEFDSITWRLLAELSSRELSGNTARDVLQTHLSCLTAESAELLKWIIKKDLRAGFGASTVNKVMPGLIPEYPYMRCSLVTDVKLDHFSWKAGVFSQLKADGMFVNIDHYEGGVVRVASRQGSPFPIEQFDLLVNRIRGYLKPGTQTHGELVVHKDGELLPREQSNGLLNSVLQGGEFAADERPYCLVWDQIPLSAVKSKGRYDVPYCKRFDDFSGNSMGASSFCR